MRQHNWLGMVVVVVVLALVLVLEVFQCFASLLSLTDQLAAVVGMYRVQTLQ